MWAYLRRATRRDDGAGAVEYALMVSAIAAVLAVIALGFGTMVRDGLYADSCARIKGGPSGPSSC